MNGEKEEVHPFERWFLVQLVVSISNLSHALANGDPKAGLFMTIPGIGPIVALFIIAEAEDISRFPSYRDLAFYAGLVPSLDSSGGKDRRLRR